MLTNIQLGAERILRRRTDIDDMRMPNQAEIFELLAEDEFLPPTVTAADKGRYRPLNNYEMYDLEMKLRNYKPRSEMLKAQWGSIRLRSRSRSPRKAQMVSKRSSVKSKGDAVRSKSASRRASPTRTMAGIA